ncbi:MAG: UDP-N-acetylmuramate dehydrogenase [Acidobacteriota bacterium]
MNTAEETSQALDRIPGIEVSRCEPLARHTRFGIGGPAEVFAEADRPAAFIGALELARSSGWPYVVIGGGTNLIVSDGGFPGLVLRFTGKRMEADGATVTAQAGAMLQDLVDFSIGRGLKGLETLAGIPGWVGGAVYGNAGAYGHSISERVSRTRIHDGAAVRDIDNAACDFRYRESVFKRSKAWILLEVELDLTPASREELRATAGRIVTARNEKFPPEMKCAGSIFKNLLLADLPGVVAAQVPEQVVREGKIPAAWFLEQSGAKGLARGGVHVASYHANLIYNDGSGTARELRELIGDLKARVLARFGLELEEEVQYVGFDSP